MKFLRYFDKAEYARAMANNPPQTEITVIRTKIIINLIRADDIAGEIVEGNARGCMGRCRKFEVESESGLGSSALRRRKRDKSVIVPSRPPR
jgi:hypothetical protein